MIHLPLIRKKKKKKCGQFAWCDDRLLPKVGTAIPFNTATDWQPQIDFSNGLSLKSQIAIDPFSVSATSPFGLAPDDPLNACKAWGVSNARYYSQIIAVLDFAEFPFDKQTAEVRMESNEYDEQVVRFAPAYPERSYERLAANMLLPDFTVTEWTVRGSNMTAQPVYYKYFNATYDRLSIRVFLERQPSFYVSPSTTRGREDGAMEASSHMRSVCVCMCVCLSVCVFSR